MSTTDETQVEYDDFITDKPDVIRLMDSGQLALAKEYSVIMLSLRERPKTVKELHILFWDQKLNKFTKTIKTVYRHLDILEQAELIKVGGHRKPKQSRITEKLYCRSAKIFLLSDTRDRTKWWKTEEGIAPIKKLHNLLQILQKTPEENLKPFLRVIEKYYLLHDKGISQLLKKTGRDESLSTIFEDSDVSEIKFIADLYGMLYALLKKPELVDEFREIINPQM